MARRRHQDSSLAGQIASLITASFEQQAQVIHRFGLEVSWAKIANVMISGESVESSNFVSGTSGWQIDGDGNAEFNSVVIRDSLYVMPSGTSFPGSPEDGELFHRTDQNRTFRYDADNTVWLPLDYIGDGARIANAIIDNAHITDLAAGKITAGTISGEEIIIAGGTSGILRSSNFSAGSAGWRIRGDGSAEFNDVTIRGDIESGNWDGASPANLVTGDLTATAGFYLDSSVGAMQLEGSLWVSGDIEVFAGGKVKIYPGETSSPGLEIGHSGSISGSVGIDEMVHMRMRHMGMAAIPHTVAEIEKA